MSALLDLYLAQFVAFLFVLTRVSGLILTAPFFGSRGAPARVRVFLAVALAVLVTPTVDSTTIVVPPNLLAMLVLLAREILLGIAVGLAMLILVGGMQVAGQIVSQMGGLSLADVFDPAFETNIPILSQLLDLLAVAIFLLIGGHRHVLGALLDSFRWMPAGEMTFPSGIVEALSELTQRSFDVGIRIAAPVMVALLLSVVITGMISRALPQLNIMAIGLNANTLVLLGMLCLSLGATTYVLQTEAVEFVQRIYDGLRQSAAVD